MSRPRLHRRAPSGKKLILWHAVTYATKQADTAPPCFSFHYHAQDITMPHPCTSDHSAETVSIIIPAYNAQNFVAQTVKSALVQDWPHTEVIVVDDGSTDGTAKELTQFADHIRIVQQTNLGLARARNSGIRAARGAYFLFLDADDLMAPDVVSSQMATLKNHPEANIAVCRNYLFETEDTQGNPIPSGEWRLFVQNLDIHLCHFNVAPVHAHLVQRSVFESIGGFDSTLPACEDHDFWSRAIFSGFRFTCNPQARVAYRRHPESMSSDIIRQNRTDMEMHFRIGERLKKNPGFPPDRGAGFLANATGSLTTALRLIKQGQPTPQRLLAQAADSWAKAHYESMNPAPIHRYLACRAGENILELNKIGIHCDLTPPPPAGDRNSLHAEQKRIHDQMVFTSRQRRP